MGRRTCRFADVSPIFFCWPISFCCYPSLVGLRAIFECGNLKSKEIPKLQANGIRISAVQNVGKVPISTKAIDPRSSHFRHLTLLSIAIHAILNQSCKVLAARLRQHLLRHQRLPDTIVKLQQRLLATCLIPGRIGRRVRLVPESLSGAAWKIWE